ALAAVEKTESVQSLAEARRELDYVGFEDRYRGTEQEIRERLRRHLPELVGREPVLDLGCGRGELLSLLRDEGVEARGVDGSREMVERCRERGLEAEHGDLFDLLGRLEAESLGAVVSIHVIEHLPPEEVERLVRLAHRVLRPGGVLLLETPNPRSVVVGASRFWIDPTHRRPVHPDTLRWMAGSAGFDEVEIRELHRFPEKERIPELGLEEIPSELHELVDRLDRQRDRIEDLLHGHQDYALVARK
ncbi:MAG: class I SAM-dependent methyltransferase, partial [Thermoanaerobaculia bacterium]|nr:class I SAM-dependent methyltransferase [Thermoanaerobaculia bacterium]